MRTKRPHGLILVITYLAASVFSCSTDQQTRSQRSAALDEVQTNRQPNTLEFSRLASPQPSVALRQGILQGGVKDKSEFFKGVRYAEPPTGNLRFSRSLPYSRVSTATIDATKWGSECIQPVSLAATDEVKGSEDCLYLNVWRPTGTNERSSLPVYFWIYGGGFTIGSASSEGTPFEIVYDGAALAERSKAIVITLNYRLGSFGFLRHPSLTSTDGDGNHALYDIITGLQWVQKNIESFGGDRNKVTIFGQSAGAGIVNYMIVSPLARGLFHGAISQSGGLSAQSDQDARTEAAKLADALGCTHQDKAKELACLRSIPAENIVRHTPLPTMGPGFNLEGKRFGIVGGEFLPSDVYTAAVTGKRNDVPIIIGSTTGEALNFMKHEGFAPLFNATDEEYKNILMLEYGLAAGQTLYDFYHPGKYPSMMYAATDLLTDILFTCVNRSLARAYTSARSPVYRYLFDHRVAGIYQAVTRQQGLEPLKPFHIIDVIYSFQHVDEFYAMASELASAALSSQLGRPVSITIPAPTVDRVVEASMLRFWQAFSRFGNPNTANPGSGWLPMSKTGDHYLDISTTGQMRASYHKQECDFIETLPTFGFKVQ